jgi:hypothetical protein
MVGIVVSHVVGKLPTDGSPMVLGGVVGLTGPLALRSPVRKSEVKGRESPMGITYLYDVARLYSLYALDERMTRLRRRDVSEMRQNWITLGWTSEVVAEEVSGHLQDYSRLDDALKSRITEEVGNALTLPQEDQRIDSLIKLLRRERFRSLIDHFSNTVISSNDTA